MNTYNMLSESQLRLILATMKSLLKFMGGETIIKSMQDSNVQEQSHCGADTVSTGINIMRRKRGRPRKIKPEDVAYTGDVTFPNGWRSSV
jgi:hypothetical protein